MSRQNSGMTAATGHEGTGIPPGLKKLAAETKKAEKVIKQQSKREIAVLSGPFAKMSHDEMKLFLRKEILGYIKDNRQPAGSKLPRIVKDYVHCLIDPNAQTEVRIPDGKSRNSALASSYNVFSVTGNWASGTDDSDKGRFCWCVTPVPLNFGWYQSTTSNQPISYDTNTGSKVQDTAFQTRNAALASFAAELNPELTWDPINSFFYDSVPALTVEQEARFSAVSAELLDHVRKFPELSNKKAIHALEHLKATKRLEMLSQAIVNSKTTPQARALMIKEHSELQATREHILATPLIQASWNLHQDQDAAFLVGTGDSTNPITVTWGSEFVSGNARTMRPVAQSVWFENVQTEFADAGSVSISYLPCNALIGNIIPTAVESVAPAPSWGRKGPLQNWEQHTTLPNQNTGANNVAATTYVGKFKTGAYAYWLPEDPTDYEFLPPTQMCMKGYPIIVVSGQNGSQAVGAADPGIIANLHINTVYEYETDEPNLDSRPARNYPGALEEVAGLMRGLPQCMSNDSHKKWWQVVLKALGAAGLGFLAGGPVGALSAGAGSLVGEL